MATRRVRVIVTGRVQGVGFRWACRSEAERLGLAGWVRNRPDGSVEAAFEGADDAVDDMVAWCRRGPTGARVTAVDVRPEEPAAARGFRIAG